jgi:hypothetical protein
MVNSMQKGKEKGMLEDQETSYPGITGKRCSLSEWCGARVPGMTGA